MSIPLSALECRGLSWQIEQDLSIAARSFSVTLAVLNSLQERDVSSAGVHRHQAVCQEIADANSQVQAMMEVMNLHWQPVPVERYLHTQILTLYDSLAYGRPEAVREYGRLDPAAASALAAGHSVLQAALREWTQAIGQRTPEGSARLHDGWQGPAVSVALTPRQRVGFGSFLQTFAGELLLTNGYAALALPPGLPALPTGYDETAVGRMLAEGDCLASCLDATAHALRMEVYWVSAAGEAALRHTSRAEESSRRVCHVISQRLPDFHERAFGLLRAAQQATHSTLGIKNVPI